MTPREVKALEILIWTITGDAFIEFSKQLVQEKKPPPEAALGSADYCLKKIEELKGLS